MRSVRVQPLLRIAVLAAFLLGACRVPAAEAPAPLRFLAAGAPREMGRQIGVRFKDRIVPLAAGFGKIASDATNLSPEALAARALRLLPALAREDVEEMRGVAQGAGLPFETIVFLNCFYSVVADPPACRQLAAWDEAAVGAVLLHGRNLDWYDYPGQPLARNHLILDLRPTPGTAYLLLTWPGFQAALTGTNRAGITVAFNQLGGRKPDRIAEPIFFTLKRALRTCKTIGETIDLIRKAAPLGNGSILVSDAVRGDAVVVEIEAGKVGVRRAASGLIGNANHFTADAGIPGVATGGADWPVCTAARKQGLPLTPGTMQEVLQGAEVLAEHNILSVVFVPTRNRMHLACGGPSPAARGGYRTYTLFEP